MPWPSPSTQKSNSSALISEVSPTRSSFFSVSPIYMLIPTKNLLTRTSGTQAAGACRVPARSAVLAHRLRWQACAPIVWMRPVRFRAKQVCAAVTHAAPFPGLYAALPRCGSFSVGAYANRAESAAFAALRPVLGFKLALSYFAFASTSGAMSL